MYTDELINLLLKNKNTRKIFCGVLALDQVPLHRVRRPCSFIINTDVSALPGHHWFAVFIPRYGPIEYFDSFGIQPRHKRIFDFIMINQRKFIYNKKRIQADLSENCGQFSLLYLYYRSRGYTMNQYLKFFMQDDYEYNDKIIDKLYKSAALNIPVDPNPKTDRVVSSA